MRTLDIAFARRGLLALLLLLAAPARADQYSDVDLPFRHGLPTFGAGLHAVATFHSIGLYWGVAGGGGGNAASIRFRPTGSASWKRALPLWFDARNAEYRGSIVLVTPGTSYDVEATLASGAKETTQVTTWSEDFPVGKTVYVSSGSATLTIDDSGSAQGYVLYTAAPGSTAIIDQGFDGSGGTSCVDVFGSYVIVRGLTLKNCKRQGVEIHAGAHDVVVEENDISGFGGGDGGAIEGPTDAIVPGYYGDGGVFCNNEKTSPKVDRVIVQRNTIHDPRYGSISWEYAHPNTTNAIYFNHCGTNHVIRYNDVRSSPGHYYGDGIGGNDNFTYEGFPNADSDIYGNRISEVYDDAIEADGGNRNVRIWGNYMHHTFNKISQAANSVGPAYTFRNVANEAAGMFDPAAGPDQEDRGPFLKVGSRDPGLSNAGRIYFFHNTSIQAAPPSGIVYPMGIGNGIEHSAGVAFQIVSRNNILDVHKTRNSSIDLDSSAGPVDVDYDLMNAAVVGAPDEPHGMAGAPTFAVDVDPHLVARSLPQTGSTYRSGTSYEPTVDPSAVGDFQLSPSSPGYHAAVPIDNFNDDVAQPDVGAHQSGAPPMEFGVDAYRAAGAAPTDDGGVTGGTLDGGVPAGSLDGGATGGTLDGGVAPRSPAAGGHDPGGCDVTEGHGCSVAGRPSAASFAPLALLLLLGAVRWGARIRRRRAVSAGAEERTP